MAVEDAAAAWQHVVHRMLVYTLAAVGLLALGHYASLGAGLTRGSSTFIRSNVQTQAGYTNCSTESGLAAAVSDREAAAGDRSDISVPANKVLLGSWEDIKLIEASYWHSRSKADALVLAGSVQRTWEAYLAHTAYYPCPLKERLGDVFDGGKWLCAVDALINAKPSCVVFSLGSAGEVGFELEVVQRMPNCRTVVFDPSLDDAKRSTVLAVPHVTLHEVAITGTTTEQTAINDYTGAGHQVSAVDIPSAMRLENLTWIDVIKMDIETYEFEVMEAIFNQSIKLPCTFFLVELHTPPWEQGTTPEKVQKVLQFFKGMQDMGFRVYNEEPNMFAEGFTQTSNIVEMAFINVDADGLVIVGPEVAAA